MQAYIYKLSVSGGVLESLHGFDMEINEIHIPELKISANSCQNEIHFFQTYDGRYSKAELIGKIDFPDRLALDIRENMDQKDEIEKLFSQVWVDCVKKSKGTKTKSKPSRLKP